MISYIVCSEASSLTFEALKRSGAKERRNRRKKQKGKRNKAWIEVSLELNLPTFLMESST